MNGNSVHFAKTSFCGHGRRAVTPLKRGARTSKHPVPLGGHPSADALGGGIILLVERHRAFGSAGKVLESISGSL